MKVLKAYEKALMTWGRWVDANINPKKTQVVFRGYSLTHFRYVFIIFFILLFSWLFFRLAFANMTIILDLVSEGDSGTQEANVIKKPNRYLMNHFSLITLQKTEH